MKVSLNVVFATLLVIIVAGFEYWQYQDAQTHRETLNKQLIELHGRIEAVDARLSNTRAQIQRMEESSLSGVIEGANQALISGWSEMLESVERELEAAREKFHSSRKKADPADPQQADPQPSAPSRSNGQGPL
ncbi:MAG: hypothetical protein R3221_07710 [Spongiibacter sp.]|uniref:Uncharacterized protein n=1 Tax=Spongiibacter thalassae TaxID=2721624 RepID=A0ABX1GHQ7_9GAMM|nr:hypothetical protein [Spongiibacter thalassae]MDX1505588.1 hypothetical protein [Spongiibacter sp.]NKI17958.1 hypothetical protein [Spongiibacter thalassae]